MLYQSNKQTKNTTYMQKVLIKNSNATKKFATPKVNEIWPNSETLRAEAVTNHLAEVQCEPNFSPSSSPCYNVRI